MVFRRVCLTTGSKRLLAKRSLTNMPIRLKVVLPAHAIEKLMDRYREGDPELMVMLKEFRVLAIQPEDKHASAVWEQEGGK